MENLVIDILWQDDLALAYRPAGSDWSDISHIEVYRVERNRKITSTGLSELFPFMRSPEAPNGD